MAKLLYRLALRYETSTLASCNFGLCKVVKDNQHSCTMLLSAVKAGSTFLSSSKSVHAWCFEAILIANNYTPGSSKGDICVLHTPKSNHKHSISMVTTRPL